VNAEDSAFQIYIDTCGIGLFGSLVDRGIGKIKVVLRAAVYDTSVGDYDIKASPFLPNLLEKIALRVV
jgi:hypothetical protein